ncbi:MAG: hypothetical protein R3C20_18575 [Planctomycetaceae bacterium]
MKKIVDIYRQLDSGLSSRIASQAKQEASGTTDDCASHVVVTQR